MVTLCSRIIHGYRLFQNHPWLPFVPESSMVTVCSRIIHGYRLFQNHPWLPFVPESSMVTVCSRIIHGYRLFQNHPWLPFVPESSTGDGDNRADGSVQSLRQPISQPTHPPCYVAIHQFLFLFCFLSFHVFVLPAILLPFTHSCIS